MMKRKHCSFIFIVDVFIYKQKHDVFVRHNKSLHNKHNALCFNRFIIFMNYELFNLNPLHLISSGLTTLSTTQPSTAGNRAVQPLEATPHRRAATNY